MPSGEISPRPRDFDDLGRELDRWAEAGRVALFWWRDDDAAEPTPALTELLDLSDRAKIEVAVAVVPMRAGAALAEALLDYPRAVVVQHGYQHQNHAAPGHPAIECGGERPVAEVIGELREGAERLGELFGDRGRAILAAPWNRIAPDVLGQLASAGFCGASAAGPRAAMAGAGLAIANAHVDPINWRERRFAGQSKALSGIIGELQARRTGESDPDEPLGLLTHHLDHDADTWAFLDDFFAATNAHPAARWLTIDAAFASGDTRAAIPA